MLFYVVASEKWWPLFYDFYKPVRALRTQRLRTLSYCLKTLLISLKKKTHKKPSQLPESLMCFYLHFLERLNNLPKIIELVSFRAGFPPGQSGSRNGGIA